MSTLYTLVGLPGSGKSTFAQAHKDCVVISSDEVREELYGDASIQRDPRKVFAVVNHRVAQALAQGHDVIYDATSLTSRLRRGITKTFDARHVAVFVNTDVNTCIQRDKQRARTVGEDVIRGMAMRLSPPSREEGFDEIITL